MYLPLYYSSVTGNTKKLASYLKKNLKKRGHVVPFLNAARNHRPVEDADLLILAFWCRRSSMDDASLKLLSQCQDRKILAVGTMGGNVEGDYGRRVENNIRQLIEEKNQCIGVCLCKGAIDLRRMRRRMALPQDHPRHVTQEKFQKSLLTQGHPDHDDLERVNSFVENSLSFAQNL